MPPNNPTKCFISAWIFSTKPQNYILIAWTRKFFQHVWGVAFGAALRSMFPLFISSSEIFGIFSHVLIVHMWVIGVPRCDGLSQTECNLFFNKTTVLITSLGRFTKFRYISDTLGNSPRGTRVRKATSTNFTVAHYCKKVEYNATDIPHKNHDFLPPEMIETMRLSTNFVVKQLFSNQFSKSGNLTISTEQNIAIFSGKRKKWGAALVSGDHKSRVRM